MTGLFGSGELEDPAPSLNDSIADVDARVSNIEEKIKELEVEIRKYRELMSWMRKGLAKNSIKQKALHLMKQKKAYEQQVESLRNPLNITEMEETLAILGSNYFNPDDELEAELDALGDEIALDDDCS